MAFARSPDAVAIRSEVGRTLLDLLSATRADRLRIGRDLLARTSELLGALRNAAQAADAPAAAPRGRRRRTTATTAVTPPAETAPAEAPADELDNPRSNGAEAPAPAGPAARVPAAERRAAALALVAIWRDVARDLALVGLGEQGEVRQLDLLDDLEAVAARLTDGFAATQLHRLDVAGERLEGNVSPELVVDELVLGWVA